MNDLIEARDVVVILREQHQTVRRLMSEVTAAAPAARAAAFDPLVRMLAVHETGEEIVVYPALRKAAGAEGEALADARTAEEDQAKAMLAELEAIDPATDEFLALFARVSAAIAEHATAEEDEVFPLLARTHDAGEMRGLGADLEVAERLAPTHAHAWAPESATANKIVGPFVAVADRVRDLYADITGRHSTIA